MIKGQSPGRYNIINIYAPNTKAPKYMKQTLTELKGKIDSNTIIVDFNTQLSVMGRTSREINRQTEDLNTMDQMSASVKA